MKTGYFILISFFFSMSYLSCTKETQSSSGNPVPVITLNNTSTDHVIQFKDSLTITLGYDDGDGDIGYENADINSLEIRDTRLSKPDFYYVPPQAPIGSKIHIKGTLKVQIRNLFLLGSGSSEVTTLEIRLQDRAGNWSNMVTTPEITIQK